MIGIQSFHLFVVSAVLLNLTPGADTLYILGRSVSQGRSAGMWSVLGIMTGIAIHTILASLGLSILLAKSAVAFNLVKLAGAAYLIYLGIRALLAKTGTFITDGGGKATGSRIYLQGVLTNVLNPKVALFFLAFLPQFVRVDNPYGVLPFLLLGLTFISTNTIWCLVLVASSSLVTEKLRANPRIRSLIGKLSGLVFVGLGLNLLRARAR